MLVDVLKSKGFEVIGEEKWYVYLQRKSKNIKIPKLNVVPEILVNHLLDEADLSKDEFFKIRGNLKIAS